MFILFFILLHHHIGLRPQQSLTTPQQGLIPFVIVAHMGETPEGVEWGLDEGANGIEMDLQFSSANEPMAFAHSSLCDCLCACVVGSLCPKDSMCRALWDLHGVNCRAKSSADAMTLALGTNPRITSRLALLYIDAKLNNQIQNLFEAGRNVVKLLNANTLAKEFKGQVILNGVHPQFIDFLRGALAEAKSSQYESSYFYTMDNEGRNWEKVWESLNSLDTPNIVYWTGTSICLNTNYEDAIKQSIGRGGYASVGIWTVDRERSMRSYLGAEVNAIMTNRPRALANLINTIGGYQLSQPGFAINSKINSTL